MCVLFVLGKPIKLTRIIFLLANYSLVIKVGNRDQSLTVFILSRNVCTVYKFCAESFQIDISDITDIIDFTDY